MKNSILIAGAVVVLLIGAVWLSKSLQSKDPNIISRTGIHWHPELTIFVKGEKQVIPAGIGVGAKYASLPSFNSGMTSVHTHDDASQGIIHLEFDVVVRKSDITLEQFLMVWQKSIDSFGPNMKMTVNGQASNELGNYVMHDGDKIVLNYE